MDTLPVIWFIAIAALWTGYLLLEGFDLGVGMHMIFRTRKERDRRVMLNTIGPVWDGNEVWLITAAAAMFAAFPLWYASLFSVLYLPLTITLLGLIFRAVAIEYRGKAHTRRWRTAWTYAIGLGSLIVSFCIGAMLALTSTGLPINENGDREGGPFVWLTPIAVLGGLALVGFALAHGATFLSLKADGPVRVSARAFSSTWAPLCLIPAAAWALVVQVWHGFSIASIALSIGAVVCAVTGWMSAIAEREGRAFIGYAGFGIGMIAVVFVGMFPRLLPSTLSPAFDLTVWNAASGSYTLMVMTIVTCLALPLVVLYQAWSYWIFRKRVTPGMIPDSHLVIPAILREK